MINSQSRFEYISDLFTSVDEERTDAWADVVFTLAALSTLAQAAQATRPLAAEKAWTFKEVASVRNLDEALDAVPAWVLDSESE